MGLHWSSADFSLCLCASLFLGLASFLFLMLFRGYFLKMWRWVEWETIPARIILHVGLGSVGLPERILIIGRVTLIVDHNSMVAHWLLTLFLIRLLSFDKPLNMLKQVLEGCCQWLHTYQLWDGSWQLIFRLVIAGSFISLVPLRLLGELSLHLLKDTVSIKTKSFCQLVYPVGLLWS